MKIDHGNGAVDVAPDTVAAGNSSALLARLMVATARLAELRSHHRRLLGEVSRTMDVLRELRRRAYPRTEPASELSQSDLLASPPAAPSGGPFIDQLRSDYHLTERELQVALHVAAGQPNDVIAAALAISSHTARHHTGAVLAKLGVHSRAQAAVLVRDLASSVGARSAQAVFGRSSARELPPECPRVP